MSMKIVCPPTAECVSDWEAGQRETGVHVFACSFQLSGSRFPRIRGFRLRRDSKRTLLLAIEFCAEVALPLVELCGLRLGYCCCCCCELSMAAWTRGV